VLSSVLKISLKSQKLDVNPGEKVPVLEIGGSSTLITESERIIEYLQNVNPTNILPPLDSDSEIRILIFKTVQSRQNDMKKSD
jgi:glutathione S-transferase